MTGKAPHGQPASDAALSGRVRRRRAAPPTRMGRLPRCGWGAWLAGRKAGLRFFLIYFIQFSGRSLSLQTTRSTQEVPRTYAAACSWGSGSPPAPRPLPPAVTCPAWPEALEATRLWRAGLAPPSGSKRTAAPSGQPQDRGPRGRPGAGLRSAPGGNRWRPARARCPGRMLSAAQSCGGRPLPRPSLQDAHSGGPPVAPILYRSLTSPLPTQRPCRGGHCVLLVRHCAAPWCFLHST